jgi:hypothetical protein
MSTYLPSLTNTGQVKYRSTIIIIITHSLTHSLTHQLTPHSSSVSFLDQGPTYSSAIPLGSDLTYTTLADGRTASLDFQLKLYIPQVPCLTPSHPYQPETPRHKYPPTAPHSFHPLLSSTHQLTITPHNHHRPPSPHRSTGKGPPSKSIDHQPHRSIPTLFRSE